MIIYLMRHGLTNWNEQGIIQGHSYNKLSETGKIITNEVANHYKDTPFEIIFSSPLTRTVQTANIMNKYHNIKIVKDKRLIEIDQGIFSGRKKNSLTKEEKKLKFRRSKKCGLENYESVYKRALDFVNFLKVQNYNCVLVVTHHVNAHFISQILSNEEINLKYSTTLTTKFSNSEIRKYII